MPYHASVRRYARGFWNMVRYIAYWLWWPAARWADRDVCNLFRLAEMGKAAWLYTPLTYIRGRIDKHLAAQPRGANVTRVFHYHTIHFRIRLIKSALSANAPVYHGKIGRIKLWTAPFLPYALDLGLKRLLFISKFKKSLTSPCRNLSQKRTLSSPLRNSLKVSRKLIFPTDYESWIIFGYSILSSKRLWLY